MDYLSERQVREELAGLSERDKLVGADHLSDHLTAAQISELRSIPLRTVERAIARVLAAIDRAGVPRPQVKRAARRQSFAGFTPALMLAL